MIKNREEDKKADKEGRGQTRREEFESKGGAESLTTSGRIKRMGYEP